MRLKLALIIAILRSKLALIIANFTTKVVPTFASLVASLDTVKGRFVRGEREGKFAFACFSRRWAVRALQWAATLPEWDGRTLELAAGSQGGFQAFHAAAHFHHVTKISTASTWGCDWTGQAELGRMKSGYRPRCWFPDMAYFDAVFAARRVQCPVEITRAGLGDYVCAPSSFAVLYNALRVPKRIVWQQGWTHGWSPAGMAVWKIDDGFAAAIAPGADAKRRMAPSSFNSGTLANP